MLVVVCDSIGTQLGYIAREEEEVVVTVIVIVFLELVFLNNNYCWQP